MAPISGCELLLSTLEQEPLVAHEHCLWRGINLR
jgi:hypothetical protein